MNDDTTLPDNAEADTLETACSAAVRILAADHYVLTQWQMRARKQGKSLMPVDAIILCEVVTDAGITRAFLSDKYLMSPRMVSQSAHELENQQLITSVRSPHDGRYSMMHITEEGRDIVNLLLDLMEAPPKQFG